MADLATLKGFAVAEIASLELDARSPLSEMYTLSPFVWCEGAAFKLLVRAVNYSDIAAEKVARIYYGTSADGLRFKMGVDPVIAPGPDAADKDGCEDPTVAIVHGTYHVYYTGWNQTALRGQLLLASGPNIHGLVKREVTLAMRPDWENPKEATIVQACDGSWRLFFEYATGGASKIGLASGPEAVGPWTVLEPLFDTRNERWDSWHLSTGPVLMSDPKHPVMFYNGATMQAQWRIGWIVFDERFERVVARCEAPLIVPPPARVAGDTDIAFAASAVEAQDGAISLYYSIADKDMFCATIVATV
ncbi:MAG TPA: hypothetical protein VNF68_01910 [Candidatus Baltobacteraceae bacterium]|nr:hypothetical protein [Candidatus Baltobacteraceae bacterium]